MVEPTPRFDVRVTKDFLVFSAAHFITFAGDQCERLHGHNYRVEVQAEGPPTTITTFSTSWRFATWLAAFASDLTIALYSLLKTRTSA